MILSFEFHYVSQNRVLENFLKNICEEFGASYKIGRLDNVVSLYVDGDEETLTNFSNFISTRLPLSIFFKSSAVNVVEEVENVQEEIEECILALPYTPYVLAKSIEEGTPFINNEIGKATYTTNSLTFEVDGSKFEANDSKSFDELYDSVAKAIAEGKKVKINSASGSFVYGKIDESLKTSTCKDFIVIPTDLSVVEKMVVIRENEIKALASLEKPLIRLKVNSLYAGKEILPVNRVKLKLADEILLLQICSKLHKDGVEFLYRTTQDEFDASLVVNGEFENIPQIEICVLENGEILIAEGSGYSAVSIKENLKKFDDKAHAQFASIVQEHNLFGDQVSCFYLSKESDDKFMHLSEQTGMLDLVKFPIPRSFEEIFQKIEESKVASTLLKNYKEQFGEHIEIASKCEIPSDMPNSIYTMWGILAVILGISDNVKDGARLIIENAEDFGGQKGPRVDYVLADTESLKSDFDFIKMIRSCMSFKLAGTDNITLSFGILESLAYFLVDSTDSYKENLTSKKTLLCGSLFSVRRLAEIACKNIQASNPICLNRELPIDN